MPASKRISESQWIRSEFVALLRLYRQELRRGVQGKYDECIEIGESWYKSQADAIATSHWDALRILRKRIDAILEQDWRPE